MAQSILELVTRGYNTHGCSYFNSPVFDHNDAIFATTGGAPSNGSVVGDISGHNTNPPNMHATSIHHSKVSPIHMAFMTANETVTKFIIGKCVQADRMDLLIPDTSTKASTTNITDIITTTATTTTATTTTTTTPTDNTDTVTVYSSPFHLALNSGHIEFVHSMMLHLRQQVDLNRKLREGVRKSSMIRNTTSPDASVRSSKRMSMNLMNHLNSMFTMSSSSPPDSNRLSLNSSPNGKTSPLSSPTSIHDINNNVFNGGYNNNSSTTPKRTLHTTRQPKTSKHARSTSSSDIDFSPGHDDQHQHTSSPVATTHSITNHVISSNITVETLLDSNEAELEYYESDDDEYVDYMDASRKAQLAYEAPTYGLGQYSAMLSSEKVQNDFMFQKSISAPADYKISTVQTANVFNKNVWNDDQPAIMAGFYEKRIDDLDYHVRQCFHAMSQDFAVYEKRRVRSRANAAISNRELSSLLFEVDVKQMSPQKRKEFLKKRVVKPPLEDTTELLSTESDIFHSLLKKEYNYEQTKGFALESLEQSHPVAFEKRSLRIDYESPDTLLNNFQIQANMGFMESDLLFIPKSMNLKLLECCPEFLETIYCSVAIYDTSNMAEPSKVTETFTFPFSFKEDINKQCMALFTLAQTTSSMLLLFKFSRDFKGEHSESFNDLYLKGDRAKDKEVYNTRLKASKSFFEGENVYSYFAWSAVNLESSMQQPECTIPHIYLFSEKAGIIPDRILIQHFLSSDLKRFRTIPGSIRISLSSLKDKSDTFHYLASTNQLSILIDNVVHHASRIKPMKADNSQFIELESTGIIHPISVSFNSKEMRATSMEVSLFHVDKDLRTKGLSVFYPTIFDGSFNNLGSIGRSFLSVSKTELLYSEEIRFQIPTCNEPTTHLLFKFYKHNQTDAAIMKGGKREFIAYSVLKLFSSVGQLEQGVLDLDVYTIRNPANYMSAGEKIEGATFRVELCARSTLYPSGSEGNIYEFFSCINRSPDYTQIKIDDLEQSLSNIAHIPKSLHGFIPMVLNELFRIINDNNEPDRADVVYTAYKAIMLIVDNCRTQNPSVIQQYVKYFFAYPCISQALILPMKLFIEKENVVTTHCSWFMFSILLKAIILEHDSHIKNNSDVGFSDEFCNSLTSLIVRSVGKYLKKSMGNDALVQIVEGIASFITNLLSVMNKGYALTVAAKFNTVLCSLAKYAEETTVDMQIVFFRQLFSYRHYVLLFLPLPTDTVMQNIASGLNIGHKHFIYTAFVEMMVKCLVNSSRQARMKAITFLREVLNFHDRDERYEHRESKERVYQVHFEFVTKLLEVFSDWRHNCDARRNELAARLAKAKKEIFSLESSISSRRMSLDGAKRKNSRQSIDLRMRNEIEYLERSKRELEALVVKLENDLKIERPRARAEKRHLLTCVLHILENMSAGVLLEWICQDHMDQSNQMSLIELLQTCLFAFEFLGSERVRNVYNALYAKRQLLKHQESKPNLGWGVPEWSVASSSQISVDKARSRLSQRLERKSPTIERAERSKQSTFNPINLFASRILTSSEEDATAAALRSKSLGVLTHTHSHSHAIDEKDTLLERFVDKMLAHEKHLATGQSFYILWLIAEVVELFDDKQQTAGRRKSNVYMMTQKQFIESITQTLLMFLHMNQSEKFLIVLLTYLRHYFAKFNDVLFSSEYGQAFCEVLMSLGNSNLELVRSHAAATIYILIRSAFRSGADIPRIDVMTTVALSRVLQKTIPEQNFLVESVEHIANYANIDTSLPISSIFSTYSPSTDEKQQNAYEFLSQLEINLVQIHATRNNQFSEQVQKLCEQLKKLIHDIISVNQTIDGMDTQKTEELLYGISQVYQKTPELRFIWLRQLSYFHRQSMQFIESAHCYIKILSTVLQYLHSVNSPIIDKLPLDQFYLIFPEAAKQRQVTNENLLSCTPQGFDFTEAGIISLLCTIVDFLELAEHYEHVAPLLELLIPIYCRMGDYPNLAKAHLQIGNTYSQIQKCNSDNTRQFNTYYRLCFYGKGWDNLAGKQFIYKMPKTFKLHDTQRRIQMLFNDAQLITTPKKVDESTLDPTRKFVQFHSVKPLVEEEVMKCRSDRKTKFEQNVNISAFYYETAFSKSGKPAADKVTEIFKRRVILTVETPMPFVLTRLPIISEMEKILTPIEAAIDNMDSQIQKMEDVLSSLPPNIESLQMVLQGSVRAGVNGGPKDIVESFLSKLARAKYHREHVQKLNDRCQYFLFLCEQALKVDARYAQGAKKALHVELEKGFIDTKNLFSLHVRPSSRADRMIQDYLQAEQKLSPNSMKSESFANAVSSSLESEQQIIEDEIDDMPNIVPYNRNYKISKLF